VKNRLKVLRAERDWTQADLADRLEVSRQTINAIEKGKYDPSLPLAFRISHLFGMSIEQIFDPEEKAWPAPSRPERQDHATSDTKPEDLPRRRTP
jgi:putative transcriptional regulator